MKCGRERLDSRGAFCKMENSLMAKPKARRSLRREERDCSMSACPIDCVYNDWADWLGPQRKVELVELVGDMYVCVYIYM